MADSERHSKLIHAWLWTCTALVAAIVIVGGATRLTGSGLSITEWQPIRGTMPPIGDEAWEAFFALYRESPQYLHENAHFGMAEFKAIFWWEWGHRLLGRVIGLALLLPLIGFWATGRLSPWLKRRGIAAVVLVVFQGALGWFMVASGLVDEPRVSHFRLAAHLSTALLTLAFLLWTALDVRHGPSRPVGRGRSSEVLWFVAALAVQILWGAFVAGLDAGLHYPTWPRMGGGWVPPDLFGAYAPPLAIIQDAVTVQWVHRWFAVVVVALGLTVATRALRVPALRAPAVAVAALLCGQFVLGVVTVLNFYRHPVATGVSHQAGAVALLIAAVVLWHGATRQTNSGRLAAQPE